MFKIKTFDLNGFIKAAGAALNPQMMIYLSNFEGKPSLNITHQNETLQAVADAAFAGIRELCEQFQRHLNDIIVAPARLLTATLTVSEETGRLQVALTLGEFSDKKIDGEGSMLYITDFSKVYALAWLHQRQLELSAMTPGQIISYINNPLQLYNTTNKEGWNQTFTALGVKPSINPAETNIIRHLEFLPA